MDLTSLMLAAGILAAGRGPSGAPTPCDRLAAYTADRDRIAPGVDRVDMDLPAALKACEGAVARDPDSPRLNYQLSRLHGYVGQTKQAAKARDVAIAARYPIALFVQSFEVAFGKGPEADRCRGARMMVEAARAGAFAARVAVPAYRLSGEFSACHDLPDRDQMLTLLEAARPQTISHFETLLIDSLEREVRALP